MITSWQVYWITRLDSISVVLCIFFLASLCVFIWAGMYRFIEDKNPPMIPLRFAAGVFLVSTVLGILTPSTKEMAAILVLPKIANSQEVSEFGHDVADLAKAWIEELKPKASK